MNDFPPSVHNLIADGQKIEAIKEVRALTGWGLREAKEAVERLERGDAGSLRGAPSPDDPPSPDELATRVFDLLREGRKIEAIKEVRSATGVSLADAKRFVERAIESPSLPDPEARLALPPQPPVANSSARLALVVAAALALLGIAMAVFLAG